MQKYFGHISTQIYAGVSVSLYGLIEIAVAHKQIYDYHQ